MENSAAQSPIETSGGQRDGEPHTTDQATLTVEEVSTLFGVDVDEVRRYIAAGQRLHGQYTNGRPAQAQPLPPASPTSQAVPDAALAHTAPTLSPPTPSEPTAAPPEDRATHPAPAASTVEQGAIHEGSPPPAVPMTTAGSPVAAAAPSPSPAIDTDLFDGPEPDGERGAFPATERLAILESAAGRPSDAVASTLLAAIQATLAETRSVREQIERLARENGELRAENRRLTAELRRGTPARSDALPAGHTLPVPETPLAQPPAVAAPEVAAAPTPEPLPPPVSAPGPVPPPTPVAAATASGAPLQNLDSAQYTVPVHDPWFKRFARAAGWIR